MISNNYQKYELIKSSGTTRERPTPQVESVLPRDSSVGTQIRWHYTRETETRSESHLPRDSSVGTPMQWHFTLKTFWHYTPEA